MYAIRSYYGRRRASGGVAALNHRLMASTPPGSVVDKSRITSYNVCYTKLLRKAGEEVPVRLEPPRGETLAGKMAAAKKASSKR